MTFPPELQLVAQRLAELADRVVFVGGMVRGLLVTDPAVGGSRPTRDVDLIVESPSMVTYYDLQEVLRRHGFRESQEEDAPICRWTVEGVPVDVMPIEPEILGFSNVWYRGGFDHSTEHTIGNQQIRVIDAPHFCATKLESFASRGEQDFYHHDLEDVIALVDGRPELLIEMRVASEDVRSFLAEEIAMLLADARFMDALPGHLAPDMASQARLPLVVSRLQAIAALTSTPPVPSAPPLPFPRRKPPQPPRAVEVTQSPHADGRRAVGPWQPRRSTSIRDASYDAPTRTLTVRFVKDSVYEYYEVPVTIWTGWQGAASAGRYHHLWIRNRYRFRRVR